MPRPKAPPTPSSSTDLKALERNLQPSDMGSWSALPPPALRSETSSTTYSSKPTSHRGPSNTRTPPISPKDKPLTSSPRQKRTASGMVKSNLTESIPTGPNGPSSTYALPPPPSRARKIIQMKPKGASSTNQPSPESDASYRPPASVSASAAPAKGSTLAATNSKRKQPSATSAAGRKIARKTAHSIIERRRRSKMNEEFGVLKDMIPACEGVEMHKLAILQAGIEYVKYLEGCVAQLKTENQKQGEGGDQGSDAILETYRPRRISNDRDEEDMVESDEEDDNNGDDDMGEDEVVLERQPNVPINYSNQHHLPVVSDEWSFRDSRKGSMASQASSAYPSPYMHGQPQSQINEQQQQQQGNFRQRPVLPVSTGSFSASPSQISTHAQSTSTTHTPTLLSPAFNSIHFSPDLTRTQTSGSIGSTVNSGALASTSSPWISLNQPSSTTTTKPSPQMAPLPSPQASMHLPLPPLVNSLQLPHPYAATRENSRSPGALSDGSGTAEATATAALMMLTNDWRAGAGAGLSVGGVRENSMGGAGSKDKAKGMSVRDLLSS